MPSSVRQAIAHYDFTRNNLPNIMQVADDVYLSTKPPSAQVAAVVAPTTSSDPDLSVPEALNTAFSVSADSSPAA